jgi:ketosteroid isomerase-like protein
MSTLAMNVAMAFVRAINRQDVEALVGLMTPAHRFIDSLGNVVTGREAMRAGWTAYFKMVPDYSVAIEETLTDGSVVVMLGVAQGTYTMDGTLREENRWQTPVAVRAATEDGLLAEWRVSADNEPMRLIMARCS